MYLYFLNQYYLLDMSSNFEKIGGNGIFKICQKIMSNETDIDDYDELNDAVKGIGKLFHFNSTYIDTSYIKEFIKLNQTNLVNDDSSNIKLPEMKVYRVPYFIIERLVKQDEYIQDIVSYSNIEDLSNELYNMSQEDDFDIWDGTENPERDSDYIDSEMDNWEFRNDEIKRIN
jgi:hypothetical protein